MSPDWFMSLNKLLRKSQTLLVPPSKSSLSLTTSLSEDQSTMTMEPESSMNLTPAVPRMFALVVAIDEYKHIDNLTGCKNDGKRFIDYLMGDLGVPLSQILFLANEDATQSNISNAFEHFLIRNVNIQRDDPIVFFFAGHGYKAIAPPGWVTDNGNIEILCPHDVRTIDDDGNELWGISDRAIDKLMRRLAFSKGDNIVVVFDCCCSGGLARAAEESLRVRSIPSPLHPPPADLNREIWESESIPEPCARGAHTVIPTGFLYKSMESHVLLAACRPDENAMEDTSAKDAPGGLFTTALLIALRKCGLQNTTYTALLGELDLKQKNQHPQCEGTNKDRLLFSMNTLHNGETTFKVSQKGGRLYVSAGSIHGVAVDTEFSVTTSTNTFVLKVKRVEAFEALLERTHHDITDATAKVSHWHHPALRVHSSLHLSTPHVTVVPAEEQAEISLHQVDSGKWQVERYDPLITAHSNTTVYFDADQRRILDAIANFNSYLYRPDSGATSFAGRVKVRMNRLGFIDGEAGPVGDDLLQDARPSHSGVDAREVTITDLDSRYCFTLENTSEVDLFPYFLYFDPSDYSIQRWYQPTSPTMLAPLKRNRGDGKPSSFGLGYGGFGTNPVEFSLPSKCERDSGFLKLFLTTTYVDMTSVEQKSLHKIDGLNAGRSLWSWPWHTFKGMWACETFVMTCKK